MYEPAVETLPWADQPSADDPLYRRQIDYLFARSPFYRMRLTEAGFANADAVGGLARIADLPFTEKDDLRKTRTEANAVGAHLAAPFADLVRIFSTSGTTGAPSYIPLTGGDLRNWVRTSARSYTASGVKRGEAFVSTYNAGPFVAGVTLDAFQEIGLCHIPVGSGNTERLMAAIRFLKPTAMGMTPSYALHLAEWARQRGIEPASQSVRKILVAGEPGGGEPAMRQTLEAAWNADVTEAMGIGDISVSVWGECTAKQGMHFSARGFVHFELIDPATGMPVPMVDGAEGELVYTHLQHQAAPLLRFRSRDHVVVWTGPCKCGRTAPRVRCIGRTDDMLIVRGVNIFPTALRDLVSGFAPETSGVLSVRPTQKGFRQDPPHAGPDTGKNNT
ncbi:MAG: AMP-binding protein [Bauldia sp.]